MRLVTEGVPDGMTLWEGDCVEVLRSMPPGSVDSLVTDPPAGVSYLGSKWDGDKGGRDQWVEWMTEVMSECFRVLKPGAHGLVWALPRTSHWTAWALEDAGFEIRDCVVHLFGTGYPKSLDIGKAIDKHLGVEREVVGKGGVVGVYRQSGSGTPQDAEAYAASYNITAPASDAAKQWDGWHSALKPGGEHWWLIRKPIAEKSVAANVLTHGVGGINVGGCRVDGDGVNDRWPTNVVLSESAAAVVDEQGSAARFYNVVPDPPFLYTAKAPDRERPKVAKSVLRLRDDLTAEQVDLVKARLLEAGVSID